jgi:LysR family hydrogen peroxide-inducible transcriptional activator
MQLHQLKYFVSIVDTGSITKAAKLCFISQPSISQQIAKLENTIGKKLFIKIDGKLKLTDPGHILYEQASKILKSVDDAKRQVKDFDSANGGTVNIGILPTLAPFMLPNALDVLSQKFPNAIITIREEISETLVAAAKRGELDILIEALPFDKSNLNIERLFLDSFYLVVHSEHPLATKEKVHINDLDGMSFILLDDVHCLTQQIAEFCFNEKFLPKATFQASHICTIKMLIETKYGVSILPSISKEESSDTKIRFVKLVSDDSLSPHREIVLATVKDRYFSPAAKFFIETIKQQYKTP